MTWLDDRPFVMSPDIIASIKLADGETDHQHGHFGGGTPGHHRLLHSPVYRGEKGLAVLGPKHFGFRL